MNHHSKVAIAVSKENWDNAPKIIKDYINEGGFEVIDRDYYVVLYHNWIKWHEEDEDVVTITKWYEALGKNDFGFIRLGKDDNDNEVNGSPIKFELKWQRMITF